MAGTSVKITNARCEAKCTYCYEQALRDSGDEASERPLDLDAIMTQMEKEWYQTYRPGETGNPPYLHGGEALLAGHDVVETLMRKSFELAGSTNIQTYGYLIDDRYIEIFKRYNASVGISIDGPWPLNKARPVPHMSTKEVTELVHNNILRLRAEGIPVSIICVLTKVNATKEHLPKLKEWILWLRDIGITSGRLNLMHTDKKMYGKALELTEEEAAYAWSELFKFCMVENDGLYWQPFHDAVSSVLGLEQGTCIFSPCEYFHANAEPVILSDGTTANCLKTAKTGHMYPRMEQYDGDHRGFGGIRYEVLKQISVNDGGCGGCKHWRSCMAGCPSEGIDGDWRNKTRFCAAYYSLFESAEKYLRRLIPNLRFVSDAGTDGATFMGEGAYGLNPPAWRFLDPSYTIRPSTWKQESQSLSNRRQGNTQSSSGTIPVRSTGKREGWVSDGEHVDGEVWHLDRGHADGFEHGDSGPRSRDRQVETIRERLSQSSKSLKQLSEGRQRGGE